MNTSSVPRLLVIGLLSALAACQTGVTPSPSPAAVPTIAAPTAKPLAEHVVAEWNVISPAGIYIAAGSVWVPEHGDDRTTRIDPVSGKVIEVVNSDKAEPAPVETSGWSSSAAGFGSLWSLTRDNKLYRADAGTGQAIASIVLEDGTTDIGSGLHVSSSEVWVTQSDKNELIRVDPATNRIVSKTPWSVVVDEAKAQTTVPAGKGTEFVWGQSVGDEGGGGGPKGLLRMDPSSGAGLTFLSYAADQNADGAITITDEYVWYGAGAHLYRINVATNKIDATYPIATGIIHVAVGFGSVWLANFDQSLVQRLDVAP